MKNTNLIYGVIGVFIGIVILRIINVSKFHKVKYYIKCPMA